MNILSYKKLILAVCLTAPSFAAAHPGSEKAIHHYQQKIANSPSRIDPHVSRAMLYIHEKKFHAAMADIAAIEKLDPDFNTGYLRGLTAYNQGDHKKAITQLDRFISEYPADANALALRGRTHRLLGDNSRALEDLLLAVHHQVPFTVGLAVETASLADQLGHQSSALSLIDEAMETQGELPPLQLAAVKILETHQAYDKAINRLQSLIDHHGNNPDWHIKKARLYAASNNRDNALNELEIARSMTELKKQTPWRERTLHHIAQASEQLKNCANKGECVLD